MRSDMNMGDLNHLWGEGAVRAFICHKSEDKRLAKDIKTWFADYGIASFVAHEDIVPLKEWEPEIERALFSMDVLIALLTEEFSDSNWTDQEIGVAVGRGIPIIPIRMGKDPYGLIGKYQAIPGSPENGHKISSDIVEFLIKYTGDDDKLRELAKEIFVADVATADSFFRANRLAGFLEGFDSLSSKQADSLVEAFNKNSQVYQASEFYPIAAGELSRLTGESYSLQGDSTPYGCKWLVKYKGQYEAIYPDDLPF